MTVKQIYKYLLIELSKINSVPLKLYEFNYYLNKAIMRYVNNAYSLYETDQQATDDLRVLQTSVYLTPQRIANADQQIVGEDNNSSGGGLYSSTYECWLPMDYFHLLNCICTFKANSASGCNGEGDCMQKPATRLTSDAWSIVMEDVYNRPSIERPYFQIYNQVRNVGGALPMDPVTLREDAEPGEPETTGTDINGVYGVTTFDSDTLADGETPGSNQKRTFTFKNGHKESLVERTAAQRYANASSARLEIRYGIGTSNYELKQVQVDYIKSPQYIRLTQEQLDLTQDVSQIMEWPEYVCYEIINGLLALLLERGQDPRLTTNLQVEPSIVRSAPVK